jgi:hypothetical protein
MDHWFRSGKFKFLSQYNMRSWDPVWHRTLQLESTNQADYPLSDLLANDKRYITKGPAVSMLPWRRLDVITTLRHLRLNLYLPDPYSIRLWEDVLAQQLAKLIKAMDNGQRLKDLKVLIVTWHRIRNISTQQAKVLGIFEQMNMRGNVQVKTRSLDGKLKATLHGLDLTNRMRDGQMSQVPNVSTEDSKVAASDMDWEWEGGILI